MWLCGELKACLKLTLWKDLFPRRTRHCNTLSSPLRISGDCVALDTESCTVGAGVAAVSGAASGVTALVSGDERHGATHRLTPMKHSQSLQPGVQLHVHVSQSLQARPVLYVSANTRQSQWLLTLFF